VSQAAALLARVIDRLAEGRLDAAERALSRLRAGAPESRERSLAEVEWLRASIGDDAADDALKSHVEAWPDDADALHQWGARRLEAGHPRDAAAIWLRVRRLDEAADRREGIGSPAEVAFVVRVAEAVLDGLDEPFRTDLASVPVVVEDRPSEELVESCFDPRAYGLFEGPDRAWASSLDAPPLPSRIVLFTSNLLADFPDRPDLEAQVEITVLHEVGHYFGLDEDDLERMGLD
jgi:predicted Zn-dependent protease with MMP-like domain